MKEICTGDLAGVTWKERDEEEGRKSAGGYRDDPRLGLRCSVAKSCLALCNPVDCSMPGSTVLHSLWESAQIHVHWVGDYLTISFSAASFSFGLQSFLSSGSFPMSWFLASGGQSIGASASVLPMNVQGWFPFGVTGLISLQSKGLSRVFSSTTIWRPTKKFLMFRSPG